MKIQIIVPYSTVDAFSFFLMEIWHIIVNFINDFQSVVNCRLPGYRVERFVGVSKRATVK